jgi:N-acetylglucosaminyldiphosphoundecaprenol N-acetyl-beta-D-mannosaminyltransferase
VDTVEILGVDVSCARRRQILELPIEWANLQRARTVLYVNAHCLNLARKDLQYRQIINRADLVYPDGISVVWASKLLGGCPLEKVTGRDWIHDFCDRAVRAGVRIFILAGEQGISERARENLLARHEGLEIVGARHGFIENIDPQEILAEINQASPDVLLIGMGTPLQEKWLAANRDRIQAPVCWAVGALFDYVAGVEPPVPKLMNKLALEWLWRMMIDPRRKWRRYLIGNPTFVLRVLRQKISSDPSG